MSAAPVSWMSSGNRHRMHGAWRRTLLIGLCLVLGACGVADRIPGMTPGVSSISPSQGPATGGTFVRVYGSNFDEGDTSVSIGGVACTDVSVSSESELRCRVPPGNPGLQDVRVQTPAGHDSLVRAYFYLPVVRKSDSVWRRAGALVDPGRLAAPSAPSVDAD